VLTNAGPLAAALFVDGVPYGATVRRELAPGPAVGRPVALGPPPSPKYPARDARPLTSGVLGSQDFRDGTWLGWEGADTVTAVLDLGAPCAVRAVTARFLQSANDWIWLPRKVAFAASLDGLEFSEVGRDTAHASDGVQERLTQDFASAAADPVVARWVKVTAVPRTVCPPWHPGAGRAAWVFWGQVVVTGGG